MKQKLEQAPPGETWWEIRYGKLYELHVTKETEHCIFVYDTYYKTISRQNKHKWTYRTASEANSNYKLMLEKRVESLRSDLAEAEERLRKFVAIPEAKPQEGK